MEPGDTEQGDTEYNLRLSRLRLSFKIKTRQQQQQQAPDMPSRGEAAVHPAYRHAVASPTHQVQERNFRPRLSSTSSATSTDSGVAGLSRQVSRAPSLAARSPAGILRRIARREAREAATKSAEAEFEGFYRRPVSRTASSCTSSSAVSAASSASLLPASAPRLRSRSCSSAPRPRLVSDDSFASYSDELYSELSEEYADPFEEDTAAFEGDKPPPLPPRKPVVHTRPPALPPYPSTFVTAVNNIAKTILC